MYLYIHIPFCASKCVYCDFTVQLAKHGDPNTYVEQLLQEWEFRVTQFQLSGQPLKGIYVGGGTPSLLSASVYQTILNAITAHCPLAPNAELTLEANPNAVVDLPQAYQEVGFNRVSIGIQSLNNAELKTLSRNHSANQALACVDSFISGGFTNVSVDVMYGFPNQTLASWQHTLQQAATLPIQHISLYGLQVEDNTPMARLVTTPAYPLPSDDTYADMKAMACDILSQSGYQHYEISNFARPGYESQNNLNTWQQGNFVAIGAGAHGYIHPTRYANSDSVKSWLHDPLHSGESQTVSPQERLENTLIFGLRTRFGVDIPRLETQFSVNLHPVLTPLLARYPQALHLSEVGTLRLEPHFWPVSNTILADFIDLPVSSTI